MWAQIINVFLGVFIMSAPAIWDFGEAGSNNNYITGPLVAAFAMVAISDVARNARWFNIPAGVWLILSPMVLGLTSPAPVVNITAGVLIIFFSLFRGKISNRFGGGWRSLFQKDPEHIKAAEQHKQVH